MLNRSRVRRLASTFAGILYSLALISASGSAQALPGDQNKAPEVCQGIAGAAYVANALAAVLVPTPFDLAPSIGAYGSNWALRLCPPQIVAPTDVKLAADETTATSNDAEIAEPLMFDPNCYATVLQNTTKEGYNNFLGVPVRMSNWGRLGTPDVYHFNTSVDVRILGSRVPDDPSTPGDESLSDDLQTLRGTDDSEYLRIPVGYNRLAYRADTLVSILDFPLIYIPKAPSGGKPQQELVKKTPGLRQAFISGFKAFAGASSEVVTEEAAFFVLDNIIDLNFRHSQFDVIDDIYNQDSQQVWVYDVIPPVISTRTDTQALPEFVSAVLSYDAARDVYYLEAIHPGGIKAGTGLGFLERLLETHDHCNREVRLTNDRGGDASFWATGSSVAVNWTASDPGPRDSNGGVNSDSLIHNVEIRDSYPPVLIPPPSQVIELPSGQSNATVELGAPRVYDLADLTPEVEHDAASNQFQLGLTEVTWTASDGFNESEAVQLINLKAEGSNSVPIADPQTVDTESFVETEIILSGSDADYHPSVDRYDPLTFEIVAEPQNGFFKAPLLPFFIEDYRLEAGALRFADQPWQQDPSQYCRDQGGSFGPGEPNRWEMGYPYNAEWTAVDDDGNTLVYDRGRFGCTGGSSGDTFSGPRFAIFDKDQNFVRSTLAPGSGNRVEDIFWDFNTGFIYATVTDTQGPDFVHVYDTDLVNVISYRMQDGPTGTTISQPRFTVVDKHGVMYVGNHSVIKAYRQTTDRSASDAGDVFLGDVVAGQLGGLIEDMQSIAVDSDSNVYASSARRIYKIGAAEIDNFGNFQPGEFVGWAGFCSANLTSEYACDSPNQRSIGFSCTDDLCAASEYYGGEPGQFREAKGIAVDPNDVLYVSDWGNSRVQRFTSDGVFSGEAKSQGVGYGFILGDFGRPDDIEVNSNNFYILNRDARLLHIFETTPITPIDDATASVVYRSNNNYVGADSFRFSVTDGLDSAEANVSINVSRSFRPPEIPVAGRDLVLDPTLEDQAVPIVLPATDPDGDLDTLSIVLVRPPEHGELSFNGIVATYVPDQDYNGPDSFSYQVSDGRDTSLETGEVTLSIEPVEDVPTIEVAEDGTAAVGFSYLHRIDVYDPDADEILKITIDWGDGLTTEDGHFEIDGEPVPAADAMNADGTIRDDIETTGPILGMDTTGRGIMLADHVYTRAGMYAVESCVYDKADLDDATQLKTLTGASTQACATTLVEVVDAPVLAIDVEEPEDPVSPGGSVAFTVTLTNLEYELESDDPRYSELPTQGMPIVGLALTGEATPHFVIDLVNAADGLCNASGDSAFDCGIADLPYGTSSTVAIDGTLGALAPGRGVEGVALQAEWLGLQDPYRGAAKVEVASDGLAPVLATLSPGIGEPEGFEEVTLDGSNFEVGARVMFGSRFASRVNVVDSSKLTLVTPAQPAGTVDVTVINPSDEQVSLSDAWVYRAPEPPTGGGGNGGGGNGGGNTGGGGGSGGGGGAFGPLALALIIIARLAGSAVSRRPRRRRRT